MKKLNSTPTGEKQQKKRAAVPYTVEDQLEFVNQYEILQQNDRKRKIPSHDSQNLEKQREKMDKKLQKLYNSYAKGLEQNQKWKRQNKIDALIIDEDYDFFKKEKNEKQRLKNDEIRKNIIGLNTRYISALQFEVEAVYVDHTATNRPYKLIQDVISDVKRQIANPHTENSHYGKFTTELVKYSKSSILQSMNITSKQQYVALPIGSGSTGAIQKSINIIRAREEEGSVPIVFMTHYEHHSNILPWVEMYPQVNTLAVDGFGDFILLEIESQILKYETHHIIITASAASNVTSKITDLDGLNTLISISPFYFRKTQEKPPQNHILCRFCCLLLSSLSQPTKTKLDQIDFSYFSPHKNLGGSQSCGVLIVKDKYLTKKPTFPGGGTVAYVTGLQKSDIKYDHDIFNREVPGTPSFLGFYRAALSFELLKKQLTKNKELFSKKIAIHNEKLIQQIPQMQIKIYGKCDQSHRANVVTFNIIKKYSPPCKNQKQIIHHHRVSQMLTDIFGIQLRSGCFCAGPFGMMLLEISEQKAKQIEEEINSGILSSKPGYLRLDLAFYVQEYEVLFLADEIAFKEELTFFRIPKNI